MQRKIKANLANNASMPDPAARPVARVNQLTSQQAEAIKKFSQDTTFTEAAKVIDQTFHDSLHADVLDGPQISDVLFQLNRIKDLLEALEPLDKKRQRLHEAIESINQIKL